MKKTFCVYPVFHWGGISKIMLSKVGSSEKDIKGVGGHIGEGVSIGEGFKPTHYGHNFSAQIPI